MLPSTQFHSERPGTTCGKSYKNINVILSAVTLRSAYLPPKL